VLMLQMHLENLHDDAVEFNCEHCKDQEWLKESPELSLICRSVYHMKQHGPNIYVCLLCKFVEASRKDILKHIREDHIVDKDLDDKEHVQVIREVEPDEGATWCCSECRGSCFNYEEIQEHSSTLHNVILLLL